jgi:SAM-dependent methyltransferase
MKQNIYDEKTFFEKYSKMNRSVKGLEGAGEWKTLEKLLPDFAGKRVLDLGCGFGWHCQYAIDHGAAKVVKYHRTLTTYLNTLIEVGFEITAIVEPQPAEHLLKTVEGMENELRRPMMLLVSARKKS